MTVTARCSVRIVNKRGLHARAAARFVTLAARYPCAICVRHGAHEVSGKSIMGLMMLAAARGTELVLQASGEQAEDALSALAELVEQRFGEPE